MKTLFFSASARTSQRILIQLWRPITCSSLSWYLVFVQFQPQSECVDRYE